jgi:uncharacterized protein
LFDEAPKVLLDKIEQVVRLVRSKGVGVYFVTHNPTDLPDKVLGQLGNRVQHALRAFTPREQDAVKTAAETFRPNPRLDIIKVITELKVGEALVSFLDEHGRPSIVEQAFVLPPKSRLGTITPEYRNELITNSIYHNKYLTTLDRESAYEILQERLASQKETAKEKDSRESQYDYGKKIPKKRQADSAITKMAKSAASSVGRQIGRELIRGLFGILLKK